MPTDKPVASSEAARRTMQANKGRDTRPELELRRLLRESGYPGYRLHWKKAPGHPDIAYPGRRLAVFVHGCFWHRCPKCNPPRPKANRDFWEAKFRENVARDKSAIDSLDSAGWRTFVIWECELRRSPSKAVAGVIESLRAGSR